jgi:integrase
MVHRSNRRGSLMIDRVTIVGRIARASGTTHEPTFRRINEMITDLESAPPRLDILRALRDGKLKPLIVYEAWRAKKLDSLPTAETMSTIATALAAWMDEVQCGTKQKAAHNTMVNYVTRAAKPKATIADLPAILRTIRSELAKSGYAAQFNRVRSSTQAFVRDTLGKSHPLHAALSDVEKLTEKKARKNNPQSVMQLLDLARRIDPEHQGALWGMALTGMGPAEFYGDWTMEPGYVRVHGTKREARDRVVPLVYSERYRDARGDPTLTPEWRARLFARALAKASGETVQPYDLRRSYANWMEAAGIPRTRRKMYLGHAGGDVTDKYEWHEVEQFLAEDAEKLAAYVRREEKSQLKMEKRA